MSPSLSSLRACYLKIGTDVHSVFFPVAFIFQPRRTNFRSFLKSSIVKFAKAAGTTRLVSLLQPGPETFSLFDEVREVHIFSPISLSFIVLLPPTLLLVPPCDMKVILLAEGSVIYAGPVEEVVDYFSALGYLQKNTIDVADFLQSIATPDGAMFLSRDGEEHFCASQFAEAFRSSTRYRSILAQLSSPLGCNWNAKHTSNAEDEENANQPERKDVTIAIPAEFKQHYRNSFWTSVILNFKRHMTLLKRDREFLIGKTIENCGMGIGMALIFLQSAAPHVRFVPSSN